MKQTSSKPRHIFQHVVNWLYAASINADNILPVLSTPYMYPIILEKSKEIHYEWIHSASTIPNDTVFQQLATNVLGQTTVLENINNGAKKRVDEKQKGMASIHTYFKKMILAASSEDGIDVPLVPVKTFSNFFKQKSAVHAQIHLLQMLQSELKCTVDITAPLATALYHGNFTWDRSDSPNNLCSLLLGKPSPLAASGAKEATMLHLKASKGGGWSDKDI